VDGQTSLSIRRTSESPLGGLETDWLVARMRPARQESLFVWRGSRQRVAIEAKFQKFIGQCDEQ